MPKHSPNEDDGHIQQNQQLKIIGAALQRKSEDFTRLLSNIKAQHLRRILLCIAGKNRALQDRWWTAVDCLLQSTINPV